MSQNGGGSGPRLSYFTLYKNRDDIFFISTYLKTVILSINILVNETNIWHQNMLMYFSVKRCSLTRFIAIITYYNIIVLLTFYLSRLNFFQGTVPAAIESNSQLFPLCLLKNTILQLSIISLNIGVHVKYNNLLY